jgi:hypothetical protein
MKRLKLLLLSILAVVSFSSCTIDSASFGVSAVNYPTYRAAPVRVVPSVHYRTRYLYDVRPDWMRYGGNWVPARRLYRRY